MRLAIGILIAVATASPAFAQESFTLTATIRDSATGRPVPGAVVQMASSTRQFSTRSDEAGEVAIRNFEAGQYRVVIRRIGYAPLATDVVIANDTRRDFRIAPLPQALREVRVRGTGSGIYGAVGTSAGLEPIAHAKVQVAGARQSVQTDSAGQFFVPLEGPGTFMIRVSHPGFADQVFPIVVMRNQVADASTLLDQSDNARSIPPGLWKDFDQRLSIRSINNTAVVMGSDVRRNPIDLLSSLELTGAVNARGLRFGPMACVYVNGSAVPGYPINSIRPEEVTAVEVYASDRAVTAELNDTWPGGPCSETGRRVSNPRAREVVRYLMIWTKR
jgi:hypothetical protein